MNADTLASLRHAIDDYSLLCFPDQDMNDEKQLAFTQLLGKPEAEHVHFGSTGEISYFGTVGNVKDDGNLQDGVNARYQSGNQLWHSDSSFREIPSFVSILHAYEVPPTGGETEFVSMRSGYQRLSRDQQQHIASLHVIHDYVFSRSTVASVNPNHAASLPPVMHPLVRVNPENELKNYYIGSHARSVVGMPGIQSRELLDMLLEHATVPEQILRHSWESGQTVIWDNRCLIHLACGGVPEGQIRHMHRVIVRGDKPY